MKPKMRVHIDTDIGDDIDDAFALTYLLQEPHVEVIGITTVFRNALKRAKIASELIRSLDKEVPVYAGENNPLKQDLDSLIPYHKQINQKKDAQGLYWPPQYADDMAEAFVEVTPAVTAILETVKTQHENLTLLAIGPLTNLALAIKQDPLTMKKLKKIVLMGGFATKRIAEWNIRCDPEAAAIVFQSGIPIDMVGLDVTLQCQVDAETLSHIKNRSDATSTLIQKLLTRWFGQFADRIPVLHDPLAASTLHHHFVQFRHASIQVNLDTERGVTVVSEPSPATSSQLRVAETVDVQAFLSHFRQQTFPDKT